jgi:transposase-like protein
MAVAVVRCPHCQSGAGGTYGTAAIGKARLRGHTAAQCGRAFLREYPSQGRVPQGKRQLVAGTRTGRGVREMARVVQSSPHPVSEG